MERFVHRTQLGQNFLANGAVIDRAVARAELREDETVLEIGAGQGVLTSALLASPARFVHSFEIDRRLEQWLAPLECSRLALHWGDVMSFPLAELDPLPTAVVANIPYHITTPLIWKVLEELAPRGLTRLILLVQKEAAERLCAPPRTKARYPLGVTIEAMGNAETFMKVSPGSFVPPPKVWSALVHIQLVRRHELALNALWRRLLRDAFAQRRKKALNSLEAAGRNKEETARAFQDCSISPNARAEELTTDQWLALLEKTS